MQLEKIVKLVSVVVEKKLDRMRQQIREEVKTDLLKEIIGNNPSASQSTTQSQDPIVQRYLQSENTKEAIRQSVRNHEEPVQESGNSGAIQEGQQSNGSPLGENDPALRDYSELVSRFSS